MCSLMSKKMASFKCTLPRSVFTEVSRFLKYFGLSERTVVASVDIFLAVFALQVAKPHLITP